MQCHYLRIDNHYYYNITWQNRRDFVHRQLVCHHQSARSPFAYGQAHTLSRESRLANLPIVYSDGYRRAFSNKAYVLIRGHKAPILGKISRPVNSSMRLQAAFD